MKLFLVYKFTCANCSSSYISKTCRLFKAKIERPIKKDNKSYIWKHLHSTATCFDFLCFKIIDKANSKLDLKIKETLHMNGRKPNLNAQPNHLVFTLSLYLLFLLLLSVFVCFSFVVFCNSLSSIDFFVSTVIFGTFYCLNYISSCYNFISLQHAL